VERKKYSLMIGESGVSVPLWRSAVFTEIFLDGILPSYLPPPSSLQAFIPVIQQVFRDFL
jgi:hypothetical protein